MNNILNKSQSLSVLDTKVLTDLIGGDDPALIRKFQIDFLKQAKTSITTIIQLYTNNKLPEIKEAAHFLKTSAKAIGAEQLASLLEEMETIAISQTQQQCRAQIERINQALKQVYKAILNEQ